MLGCKQKKQCRASERVDEEGRRVNVEQVTVLNILEFPVDVSKYQLTPEEQQAIKATGIYCKSFESVLPHFEYRQAQHWCKEVWKEAQEVMAASRTTVEDPQRVLMLVARPQYDTEATYVNYGDCIPGCDTNSYKDTLKFLKELMTRSVGCLVRCVVDLMCLLAFSLV
jgi:hypothetical protein